MFDLEQMLQIKMVGCYRLMQMGVLFLVYLAAAVLYTVDLKLKVCYRIFCPWIYWVKLGHTSRYSGSIEESLATHRESLQSRQWRSFQCGGRVWGTPVFLDVLGPLWLLRKQHKWRIRVSKYAWICHVWMIIYTNIGFLKCDIVFSRKYFVQGIATSIFSNILWYRMQITVLYILQCYRHCFAIWYHT